MGEDPSRRTDLELVAATLGERDGRRLRADLEELLHCSQPSSLGPPRRWTPADDERALSALRSIRSYFDEPDWARVPGLFPERCFFPRRDAHRAELRVVADTDSGEVRLRLIDASQSGLCALVDPGSYVARGTRLRNLRFERADRQVIARVESGEVRRVGSPVGVLLHPAGIGDDYRQLLVSLPLKAR